MIGLLPGTGADLRSAAEALRSIAPQLADLVGVIDRLDGVVAGDVWSGPARDALAASWVRAALGSAVAEAADAMQSAAIAIDRLATNHDTHQEELRYLHRRWEEEMAETHITGDIGAAREVESRAAEVHAAYRSCEAEVASVLGGLAAASVTDVTGVHFNKDDDICPGAQYRRGNKCYLPQLPRQPQGGAVYSEIISEDPGQMPTPSSAGVVPSDPTTISPRTSPKTDYSDVAVWDFFTSTFAGTLIGLLSDLHDFSKGRNPGLPPVLNAPFDRCHLSPASCQDEDEHMAAGL